MKTRKIIFGFVTFLLFGGLLFGSPGLKKEVKAATFLSNSTEQTETFPVPEGGWSSMTVNVTYREYYSSNSSITNKFNERQKTVVYHRTYATSRPACQLGNVIHSNDSVFSSWSTLSIMYDGSKWQGGNGYKNTDIKYYAKNTDLTGTLAFLITCDGAIVPTRAGSVSLNLKTN